MNTPLKMYSVVVGVKSLSRTNMQPNRKELTSNFGKTLKELIKKRRQRSRMERRSLIKWTAADRGVRRPRRSAAFRLKEERYNVEKERER